MVIFKDINQELSASENRNIANLNAIFSRRVLVLNQSYEPLTVCSPQRAMALIFLAKADLLESYRNKYIRTVNRKFALPSVIKLQDYVKIPYRSVEISKRNIIKRDNNTCQYCGSKLQLTIDHIIPKSRGGEDTWENLVAACIRCNNSKGNLTPKEANMKLKSTPRKPNYIVFLKSTIGNVEQSWKQYLFF